MDGSRPDLEENGDESPAMEDGASADRERRRIVPGAPSHENIFFVLLGMVLTVLVFMRGLGVL